MGRYRMRIAIPRPNTLSPALDSLFPFCYTESRGRKPQMGQKAMVSLKIVLRPVQKAGRVPEGAPCRCAFLRWERRLRL